MRKQLWYKIDKDAFLKKSKHDDTYKLALDYNVCISTIFKWKKRLGINNGWVKPSKILYKINKNECWICTSHKCGTNGYPIRRNNKTIVKEMYEKKYGKIKKGLWVLHKCDNRKCINPDHIFLGTKYDNIQDMMSKDRNAFGIKHPNHKLSKNKILWAIDKRRLGWTYKKLGKKLNVSRMTISKALHNKTWKQTMRCQ
jgi:hypothetical protein